MSQARSETVLYLRWLLFASVHFSCKFQSIVQLKEKIIRMKYMQKSVMAFFVAYERMQIVRTYKKREKKIRKFNLNKS